MGCLPRSGDVPRAKTIVKHVVERLAKSLATNRSESLNIFVYVYKQAFFIYIYISHLHIWAVDSTSLA